MASRALLSRRTIVAATVAAAALLAAGCGGSSGGDGGTSPTATWAEGVCSAITTWTSSIKAIGDTLRSGNLSQDSLTRAGDDAKSATETFTSELEGLGTPDTEAGQQAKDSVDRLSTDIEGGVTTIEDALDGASGIGGILEAGPVIVTTLGTMGTQVSSTISSLRGLDAGGELATAFEDAPSCGELTG